jgi:hypothetical protein
LADLKVSGGKTMKQGLFILLLLTNFVLTAYELIYYEDFENYQPGEVPDQWIVYNDTIQNIVELEGNNVFRCGGRLELQMPPVYDVKFLWQIPVTDTCYWAGFSFSTNVEGYYDPPYSYYYAKDYFSENGLFISDPAAN